MFKLIEPDRLPLPPRSVVTRQSVRHGRIVTAACLAIVGGAAVVFVQNSIHRRESLVAHGVFVVGKVTDRSITSGKGGGSYRLVVDYPVAGRTMSTTLNVSEDTYEGTGSGDPVRLYSDPTMPGNVSRRRLTADDVENFASMWRIIGLVVAAIVAFSFWNDRFTTQAQLRQLVEWRLAWFKPQTIRMVGTALFVEGFFVDEEGEPVARKIQLQPPLNVEESIAVLIDPHSRKIRTVQSFDRVELA